MRTTLDLPKGLVDEAMRITHIKTKTALIIQALEDIVRKKKIAGIKNYKGKIDLNCNLTVLRGRK